MYNKEIDSKWQNKWYSTDYFNAKDDKNMNKFF